MAVSNQTFGHWVSPVLDWLAFDALPPRVRRVVAEAPYKFDCIALRSRFCEWQSADGDDVARRKLIAHIFVRRDESIAEAWGDDHPMIGARPKGWRT